MSPLGVFLRKFREERNISGAALAREIGISPAHLCSMELGKRKPAKYIYTTLMRNYALLPQEYNELYEAYIHSLHDVTIDLKDTSNEMKDFMNYLSDNYRVLNKDTLRKLTEVLDEFLENVGAA